MRAFPAAAVLPLISGVVLFLWLSNAHGTSCDGPNGPSLLVLVLMVWVSTVAAGVGGAWSRGSWLAAVGFAVVGAVFALTAIALAIAIFGISRNCFS